METETQVLPFKILTQGAKYPTRAHMDDAGLDLYALKDVVIPANGLGRIHTGIAVAIPYGAVGLVADRSSMGKRGIKVMGGVIDSGYRGEMQVMLWNLNNTTFEIKKDERIAQLLILTLKVLEPVEKNDLNDTNRGDEGFGSSGR